jgi:hypothetical protein
VAGQVLGRRVVDEMPQGFHEWLVGDTQFLVAPAGQDGGALLVDGRSQLDGQTGLPDTRLSGQQRDPQVTGRSLLPELLEPLQLVLPPHEDAADVGEQEWLRYRRLRQRFPDQLTGGHGVRQSLELQGADGQETAPVHRAGQQPYDLRRQDLPAGGDGTEPASLHDRNPEAVPVVERHVAGGEADPDLERGDPVAGPVMTVDGPLDGHRGGHGIGGAGERRHDAIA